MDASAQSHPPDIAELESQLNTGSEKIQLQVMPDILAQGEAGYAILQNFLLSRQQDTSTFIDGRCYELLLGTEVPAVQNFLQEHFDAGVVPLRSEQNIDYLPLQRSLAKQSFQDADNLTLSKLCELSGPAATKRKWIYFTEVEQYPIPDLQTINQLWLVHSEGKFGYSVQRQLWLSVGRNWDVLWPKINWRSGRNWTRWPDEFTWDLSAPKGHLPLSNQLRGVQVINALLSHPAWTS
ncbi:GUN4 domain-containing protein [Acaryochloris marina]|uniref:GUN4 domain-containing protein n=1 Tax=Acaryochloris marina TaxID=155978 RepID=UPI001BAE630A|nr:GUN4 domain-containing protein [Acaryochloris marina]QUY40663.1 GUN4 domain-containing protein [Acaryochloris marina S15]